MNPQGSLNILIGRILLLFGILLLLPVHLRAGTDCAHLAAQIGHGEILWTENAILVQGTAAPNLSDPLKPLSAIKREAQRAATLDAFRKAAGILTGITVSSDTMAWDHPQVISRIQAYVPRPRICKTKYYSDGGVDIVIKVPLSGPLVNALIPNAGMDEAVSKSKYTGLVVDAKDLPFTPAISPRLLGPDGSVLFSQQKTRKKVIMEKGAVKYVTSLKMIHTLDVGKNPLRVKAVSLGALSPSDLVLDRKAGRILADSPAFLGQGKVVIQISPVKKITCKHLAGTVTDRRIDWERKIVLARGFGKADFKGRESRAVRIRMMEMAAEVDAQRKLVEAFNGLVVNNNRSLKTFQESTRFLEGILRNAVRCGAKYYKNGTAEVVLAAPIDGPASTAAEIGRIMEAAHPVPQKSESTGLIINARDRNFKPVLAPEIYSADGTMVYGPDMVHRSWAHHSGIVGYQASLNKARADERIGRRPLVVRAQKDRKHDGRLVLSTKDADLIEELVRDNGPLTRGRVIIVTEHTIDAF